MRNHLSSRSFLLRVCLLSFFILQFPFCKADVLGDFRFEGTLGDKIGVTIAFAVNGDMVAVGEIVYTNHKKPIHLLLVGIWTGDEYLLNEYKPDGTVTGCLRMHIDDTTYNEPILSQGSWTNPKSGQTYEMKNMEYMGASGTFWDYGTQKTLAGDYVFHQWDPTSKSMKNGYASFRWAGDHQLHFDIMDELQGGSLHSQSDRPAELRPYTYNDFFYSDANDCGYSFEAHFFKHFVVIVSTAEDPESAMCNGVWNNVSGVYFKVKK